MWSVVECWVWSSGIRGELRVQLDSALSRRLQTLREGKSIHCVSIYKTEITSELLSNDRVLWEEHPQIYREIELVRYFSKILDVWSIYKNQLSFFAQKEKKTAKKINFLKQQQQNNRCLPIKLATVSLGVPAGPSSSNLSPASNATTEEGKGGSLSWCHRPISWFLLWGSLRQLPAG